MTETCKLCGAMVGRNPAGVEVNAGKTGPVHGSPHWYECSKLFEQAKTLAGSTTHSFQQVRAAQRILALEGPTTAEQAHLLIAACGGRSSYWWRSIEAVAAELARAVQITRKPEASQ